MKNIIKKAKTLITILIISLNMTLPAINQNHTPTHQVVQTSSSVASTLDSPLDFIITTK